MRLLRLLPFAAAVVVATLAGPARAADIPLGTSGWQAFAVDSARAPAPDPLAWIEETGYDTVAFVFQVASGTTATLSIVDAGFAGDRFEWFDGGVSFGTTSAVPLTSIDTAADAGTDFDAAFADLDFSRGVYVLAAGDHRITGRLVQSVLFDGAPLEATVGALRLDVAAAVPEPEAWAMLVAGLIATGAVARRRRSNER